MKKALLIIDVQVSSVTTEEIVRKIEEIQENYDHVFISKFTNNGSFLLPILKWEGYDNEELAFKPTKNGFIFEKNTYTSYIPEMKNFNEVYICGFDTDACILKTAMDLIENGIRPIVLSELCSSANKKFHNYGLEILKRNIGKHNII